MPATKIDPRQFCSKLNQLKLVLDQLNQPLIQIDLDQIRDLVIDTYAQLEEVDYVGPTSISKILHLLKPRFFMMWDTQIANRYDVPRDGKSYLKFLRKMQLMAHELIQLYSQKQGS